MIRGDGTAWERFELKHNEDALSVKEAEVVYAAAPWRIRKQHSRLRRAILREYVSKSGRHEEADRARRTLWMVEALRRRR